jgi:hypothetical protein
MLQRRLAAIGYMHKIANVPSPIGAEAIKATLSGIRRSIGAAPVRKKAATSEPVSSMEVRYDLPNFRRRMLAAERRSGNQIFAHRQSADDDGVKTNIGARRDGLLDRFVSGGCKQPNH